MEETGSHSVIPCMIPSMTTFKASMEKESNLFAELFEGLTAWRVEADASSMLNIVLVEPEIPQNTGNISRTCSATATRLILVHPLGFSLDERHLRRAGLDYWDRLDLVQYPSREAFLEEHGKDRLVLFSARCDRSFFDLDLAARGEEDVYFVFGCESCGLGRDMTERFHDSCVRLPMIAGTRSLNLSNTVAVATYEYYRQQGFPPPMSCTDG